MTIGLIPNVFAFLFCVAAASFAAGMLVQTLFLLRSIITMWLDHMEIKPAGEK